VSTRIFGSVERRRALRRLAVGTAVAGAVSLWAFDSAPYPYAQRFLLDLPLPLLSRSRLDRVLRPMPGERILEVGPGTGLQALHVAPQLEGGVLDIVDIQQEMLDHVMGRATRRGISNIKPNLADARELPFESNTFDAAYAVTALGEIPDPAAAICQLRRVLKPHGRLVIGEFFDRHQIRLGHMVDMATRAGMRVEKLIGPSFAYYARLRPIQ
jgi:ubiquinone/menaquinone biosynthesis C-methylase UbiE